MSAQIKDIISQCSICNEFRGTQQKEPMLPHEIPTKPWEICATDLFELDSSSKTVINILKEIFSRYGIPVIE